MQFIKKTSSRATFFGILVKFVILLFFILGVIFLLKKIDFPAPIKEIEKTIPNENFKIVK